MTRTAIPIRNMHCRSCELTLERAFLKIPGIKGARVSHRAARAELEHDGVLDIARIRDAVRDAGYEVGASEARRWLTGDGDVYLRLLLGAFAVALLWVLAERTGLLTILALSGGGGSGPASALLVGLAAGVSTCMALVGGLVLGASARHAEKHPEASAWENFRPHLFFNLGRVGGFFLLGGLLGVIGSVLAPSPVAVGLLTIAAATVMFLLGIQLTEVSPRLSALRLTLPSGIARMLGIHRSHEREYSHRSALALGALTFFLPCGFTQMMQVAAVGTRSFLAGGLVMAAFALGTAPGLLGIGGLASAVRGAAAKMFYAASGVLVVALAVANLQNGSRLTGWAPPWEGNPVPTATAVENVTLENGVQVARMRQTYGDYVPNAFVVLRGLPVRWVIDGNAPGTCTAGIAVPSLGINQPLALGENVIEFTPQQVGVIRFTCTMGMFPGQFTVIDPPSA